MWAWTRGSQSASMRTRGPVVQAGIVGIAHTCTEEDTEIRDLGHTHMWPRTRYQTH